MARVWGASTVPDLGCVAGGESGRSGETRRGDGLEFREDQTAEFGWPTGESRSTLFATSLPVGALRAGDARSDLDACGGVLPSIPSPEGGGGLVLPKSGGVRGGVAVRAASLTSQNLSSAVAAFVSQCRRLGSLVRAVSATCWRSGRVDPTTTCPAAPDPAHHTRSMSSGARAASAGSDTPSHLAHHQRVRGQLCIPWRRREIMKGTAGDMIYAVRRLVNVRSYEHERQRSAAVRHRILAPYDQPVLYAGLPPRRTRSQLTARARCVEPGASTDHHQPATVLGRRDRALLGRSSTRHVLARREPHRRMALNTSAFTQKWHRMLAATRGHALPHPLIRPPLRILGSLKMTAIHAWTSSSAPRSLTEGHSKGRAFPGQ